MEERSTRANMMRGKRWKETRYGEKRMGRRRSSGRSSSPLSEMQSWADRQRAADMLGEVMQKGNVVEEGPVGERAVTKGAADDGKQKRSADNGFSTIYHATWLL